MRGSDGIASVATINLENPFYEELRKCKLYMQLSNGNFVELGIREFHMTERYDEITWFDIECIPLPPITKVDVDVSRVCTQEELKDFLTLCRVYDDKQEGGD